MALASESRRLIEAAVERVAIRDGSIEIALTRDAAAIVGRKARAVYALHIFKPPRRPRATWSSRRRVARGEIELT